MSKRNELSLTMKPLTPLDPKPCFWEFTSKCPKKCLPHSVEELTEGGAGSPQPALAHCASALPIRLWCGHRPYTSWHNPQLSPSLWRRPYFSWRTPYFHINSKRSIWYAATCVLNISQTSSPDERACQNVLVWKQCSRVLWSGNKTKMVSFFSAGRNSIMMGSSLGTGRSRYHTC